MKIHQTEVQKGEEVWIKIPVAHLPSGSRMYVRIYVSRAQTDGPTMLVLSGMHGDEINGVHMVRSAIVSGLFKDLNAGTIIAIPVINVFGFSNFSRNLHDNKDINRSFPGSKSGSLASRLANLLMKKIVPHIDMAVDFHTGGDNRYNFPQVRFTKGDVKAKEMARIFDAPVTLEKGLIPKSFRFVLKKMGIPVLVYEGGEALRYNDYAVEEANLGLQRLLNHFGMKHFEVEDMNENFYFDRTIWMRAPVAGMFTWQVPSGNHIKKGDKIGHVIDPYGQTQTTIIAKRDGYIIGHNNTPVVNIGDPLFHIAYHGKTAL